MLDLTVWLWVGFIALIALLFAVDLVAFGRKGKVSLREAVVWSLIWTVLGLVLVFPLLALQGRTTAQEYLTGFVIEKSLSTDNLFVFALIFAYFAVPRVNQRRVLFWGIVGALVLRAIFIVAGAALLHAFHATIYLFGGVLVVTGIRMAQPGEIEVHPERNPVLRTLQRFLPITTSFDRDHLITRERGRRLGTPLLAALVLVATLDVAFAIDSIPAIFAITRDTFVVFAANAFSLLGLTALYFVLTALMARFTYLDEGLAAVLILIGLKMLLSDVVAVPVWLSLLLVITILAIAIGVSLLFGHRSDRNRAKRRPPTVDPADPDR
jgi:tellurite resistance protein TerC